jgi:hypothetical protein
MFNVGDFILICKLYYEGKNYIRTTEMEQFAYASFFFSGDFSRNTTAESER